jgi:hypothetical protein
LDGELREDLSHESTDLEFHGVLGRHVDAFEDFGVLSHSSRPQFALEYSEVTVFKSVATPQLCGDLVQELLDNLFHTHSFLVRPIAGTRPRGKDADEDSHLKADLLADPKERAEHILCS